MKNLGLHRSQRTTYVVEFTFNRDENGIWVDDEMHKPRALYGPFYILKNAEKFCNEFMMDDTDVFDAEVLYVNKANKLL